MSDYKHHTDADARKRCENDAKLYEDAARVFASEKMRESVRKFDGKIINARLDSAIKAAAAEVVPGSFVVCRRGDVVHGCFPFEFGERCANGCGCIGGAYFKAGSGPAVFVGHDGPGLRTGERLDAAALLSAFERSAEGWRESAAKIRRDIEKLERWHDEYIRIAAAVYKWIYGTERDERGSHTYNDTISASVSEAFGWVVDRNGWYFAGADFVRKEGR